METITTNKAINSMLVKHTDDFEKLIDFLENQEKKECEKNDWTFKPYNEFLRQNYSLSFYHDIIKSMSQYVQSDDVYVSSEVNLNGKIVYGATFSRDEKLFHLEITPITAGGYNIQRFHYRFITKSSIKSINRSNPTDLDLIKKAIKKLSKSEKLKIEIERYEKRISENEKMIASNIHYTDEEINTILLETDHRHLQFSQCTWENHGHTLTGDREFAKNKESYESWIQDILLSNVAYYKTQNVVHPQRRNIDYRKQIEKLTRKLNSL